MAPEPPFVVFRKKVLNLVFGRPFSDKILFSSVLCNPRSDCHRSGHFRFFVTWNGTSERRKEYQKLIGRIFTMLLNSIFGIQ
jgi:hypothetical protein